MITPFAKQLKRVRRHELFAEEVIARTLISMSAALDYFSDDSKVGTMKLMYRRKKWRVGVLPKEFP
jgi:hypothetical protein